MKHTSVGPSVLCRLLVAALLAAVLSPGAQAASVAEFQVFSLTGGSGTTLLPGRLYVPPDAAADPTPRPLILWLHGAGGVGTNNTSQVGGNIDELFAEAKQRGAFVYAPQTPTDWHPVYQQVGTMLDRAIADFNVDPNRLYVTGTSLGGGGTWSMLGAMPTRFAAGIPISGTSGIVQPFILLDQSIWTFHARNDATVSVNTTRGTVNTMMVFAGEPLPAYPPLSDRTTTFDFKSSTVDLRYTEFPTGDHDIGGPRVYRDEAVYDWMFSKTLAVPEPGSVVLLAMGVVALLVFGKCRVQRGAKYR